MKWGSRVQAACLPASAEVIIDDVYPVDVKPQPIFERTAPQGPFPLRPDKIEKLIHIDTRHPDMMLPRDAQGGR